MTDRQPKEPRQDRLLSPAERLATLLVGALVVATLAVLILYHSVALKILPGEAGVRYSLLFGGTVLDSPIPEGFALKLPWDRVYRYEVRTQREPFELAALSEDGMRLQITGAILFRPRVQSVPLLHKTIGPEYIQRAVAPVAVAAVREAAAAQAAFKLYTETFEDFKQQVFIQLTRHPLSELVEFVDLAITQVQLPALLTEAIEQKLAQEQLFLSFQYRLQSEEQEAQRRRIEAIGIRTFYEIVKQALTPDLLTWRGIEATVQLARSKNSKIVVVGGGRDQLPIILGGELTRTDSDESDTGDTDSSLTDTELPDFSSLPSLFDSTTLSNPIEPPPDQLRSPVTDQDALPTDSAPTPSQNRPQQ